MITGHKPILRRKDCICPKGSVVSVKKDRGVGQWNWGCTELTWRLQLLVFSNHL